MEISAKSAPFFLVDVQSSNVYSCQKRLTDGVVQLVSLWGNDRLELDRDDVDKCIDSGIFKRVGVDY